MNKMSASNIAIVIGPNLLWPLGDDRFVCYGGKVAAVFIVT